MKSTTTIFIVLYLVLFLLAGGWFYSKYFPKISTSDNKSQSINLSQDKTIFYTMANNLYQLNADNLNRSASELATYRLQSTGQVQTMVTDPKNEFFIYDCLTPTQASEIWQVSFKDNHSEKIFSSLTPGFELYSVFRNPKLNQIGRQLAFIASNQGVDDIFVWDIDKNQTQNLTLKSSGGKITALDWSLTESKIYFTTQNSDKINLKTIDLQRKSTTLFEGINRISRLVTLKDKIVVMFLDSNDVANLGYFDIKLPSKINPLTDLKKPFSVVSFDLSFDAKQITYQTQDTLQKTNDLYIMKTDGSNLLQLTNDGKSFSPIFSPDGTKIAFYTKDSGIYTITALKTEKNKILNEESQINNLILWR